MKCRAAHLYQTDAKLTAPPNSPHFPEVGAYEAGLEFGIQFNVIIKHPTATEPGRLAQSGASLTANQGVEPRSGHILSLRFGHEKLSTTIITLPLIQEGQLSVTGERMDTDCLGGLPRNSAARLTDCARNDLKCVEEP